MLSYLDLSPASKEVPSQKRLKQLYKILKSDTDSQVEKLLK